VTATSYPAQIVFIEVDDVTGPRRWQGRLFRQAACVDVAAYKHRHRKVTWRPQFDITEDPTTRRCTATLNGGPTPHSLRHATYPDVTTAMKAGIRWAARRFRVPAETGYTGMDEAIDWLRSASSGESPEAIEIRRLIFVAYRSESDVNRAAARARLAAIINERSRP
jgi:hypothetical protein